MSREPDWEKSARNQEIAWREANRVWRGLWDDLALTADEAAALRQAERELDCAEHARSLEYLLRIWSHFVLEVELGWEDWGYEFTNDLSTRDILERLLKSVPSSVRDKVIPLVVPWDVRWKAATLRVAEPQWGKLRRANGRIERVPDSEIAWWNFRVPKVSWSFEEDRHFYTFVDEE